MRCPYCGQENPNNATRCSRCGRHLERVREKKKEKSILLIGIILVAVILAAGVGAMFGISNILSNTTNTAEEPQKVTIVSTPEPTQQESVTAASSASSEQPEEEVVPLQADSVEATPTPTEAPVTASLADVDALKALVSDGYGQAGVASSTATSTISQDGVDNDPHVLYDGAYWSSWQEGVDGPGKGESVTLTFDKLYRVRCIALKLGNWYHDISYYTRNNRPKQLTFVMGSQQFTVDFPDEKQVQYVEFSDDVECNSMQIIIDDVYSGDQYDDTCICEVTTYGKPSDGSAAANTAVVTPAPDQDTSADTAYSSGTTYGSGTGTWNAGTTDAGTSGDTGTGTYADGTGTYGTDTSGTDASGTGTTGTDTTAGTGTTG